jgi:hypothetical protein
MRLRIKMAKIAATVLSTAMLTSYHNGYIGLKPFQKNELSKPQNRNKKTTQKTITKILYIRLIERRAKHTAIKMPNEMIASTMRNAVKFFRWNRRMNNRDINGAITKSIINRISNEQNVASDVHRAFLVFILAGIVVSL